MSPEPDHTENEGVQIYVCHCFSVSEEEIISSIKSGCDSVDKIRKSCFASSGCGSCVDIVLDLLSENKSDSKSSVDPGLNPASSGYFGKT